MQPFLWGVVLMLLQATYCFFWAARRLLYSRRLLLPVTTGRSQLAGGESGGFRRRQCASSSSCVVHSVRVSEHKQLSIFLTSQPIFAFNILVRMQECEAKFTFIYKCISVGSKSLAAQQEVMYTLMGEGAREGELNF